MPLKLPKKLLPRQEVDHEIELEHGAEPLALAHYHMAPPELKKLQKQLIDSLDADYICMSKISFGALIIF